MRRPVVRRLAADRLPVNIALFGFRLMSYVLAGENAGAR